MEPNTIAKTRYRRDHHDWSAEAVSHELPALLLQKAPNHGPSADCSNSINVELVSSVNAGKRSTLRLRFCSARLQYGDSSLRVLVSEILV